MTTQEEAHVHTFQHLEAVASVTDEGIVLYDVCRSCGKSKQVLFPFVKETK